MQSMFSVHLSKWNWNHKCNNVTILELKYNYCWHKQLRWKLPSRKMKLPLGLQRDTDSCDLTDRWYVCYDLTKSKEDWRSVKEEQDKRESVNVLKRGERARSWRKTMEGEWLTAGKCMREVLCRRWEDEADRWLPLLLSSHSHRRHRLVYLHHVRQSDHHPCHGHHHRHHHHH